MVSRRKVSQAGGLSTLLLLILIAASCAPLPSQPMPPTATAPYLPVAETATPALGLPAQRAIAVVAERLNLAPTQVNIISSQQVDWPDGCLGVFQPDVMCTQAIVPGYRIILEANGQQYEVHTDLAGNQALLAPGVSLGVPIGPRGHISLRQAIATKLGLPSYQVQVVTVEPMTWPDVCLGAPQPDEICAQTLTPGYRVTAVAGGVRYVFHTDKTGDQVRPAPLTDEEQALTDILRDLVAAQLGITADSVEVVSVEAVDWPDACLGIQKPDLVCAQVLTPGFKVALKAEGGLFIYHTDATGDSILLAEQRTAR